MLIVSMVILAISFYLFWVSVNVAGEDHPIWRVTPAYLRKRWRYYVERQTVKFADAVERELLGAIARNRYELGLSELAYDFALEMLATEHALRICKTKEVAFALSDGFQARSAASLGLGYPSFNGLEQVLVCAIERPFSEPAEIARLLFHEYIMTNASRSNRHGCLAIRVAPTRVCMVAVVYLATRQYPTIETGPDFTQLMIESANRAAARDAEENSTDDELENRSSA